MTNISDIIRELMVRKGVTAYRIAQDTGSAITQPAITRILQGERTPRLRTLRILADYFEVGISHLLGEEPLPPGDGGALSAVGTCPKGMDNELWLKVPSVITEIDRDLVKGYFGPDAIAINSIEDINTPFVQKIWQYLYYVMLKEIKDNNA